MIVLNGKELSSKIKENIKNEVDKLSVKPKLAVISVGNDEASKVYVRNKEKACNLVGIDFELFHFDESTDEEIIRLIEELNFNDNINGILLQLPLPSNLNEELLINHISYSKDVDALSTISKGLQGNKDCLFVPCTAKGIIRLLDYYNIPLEGKHVVVVGRSKLVGMPVSTECLKRDATVTICHSKTKDLSYYTKQADILIVATGNKYLIDKTMIKDNSVIIDVGINRENNILYGDVNIDTESICYAKTPVPGGVGPMTVAMLLENTLLAYKNVNK